MFLDAKPTIISAGDVWIARSGRRLEWLKGKEPGEVICAADVLIDGSPIAAGDPLPSEFFGNNCVMADGVTVQRA